MPIYRGVAQFGSASALGAEGRRFESCHPDHSTFIVRFIVMSESLDKSKIGPEWSLCPRCKHDNQGVCTDICLSCTSYCGQVPFLLCGIPVGVGAAGYYHKHFEPKDGEAPND